MKVVICAIGLFILILLIGRCSNQDEPFLEQAYEEPISYLVPKTLEEVKSKISDSAWDYQMTAGLYPSTYTLLGDLRFDEANELLKWAASVGAISSSCDNVGISSLSEKSSRSELLFFVDCDNGERIWVNEKRAKSEKLKWQE